MERSPSATSSFRRNLWLTRICAVLILLDLLHLPLGLASIPRYLDRTANLSIPVYGTGIGNPLTNETTLMLAGERGMSPQVFAWYYLGIQMLAALIFTGVGVIVLRQARGHWFGWFTAHVLFFLNSYAFYTAEQVASLLPTAIIDLASVFWPTVLLYLFLFPNGRPVPLWLGWPMLVYTLFHFSLQFAGVLIVEGYIPAAWFEDVLPMLESGILGVFVFALASQIYRYSRISSTAERAQTRWLIYSIAVILLVPGLGNLLGFEKVLNSFEWGTLSLTAIPITLAVAILRYRLWDIDLIIRRTLQYFLITGVLVIVYFGGVVILQEIFGRLTGEANNTLVTVISTLGIAGIFNPLRRRVQDGIDRRFYRSRYNAEQALSMFARTARDEVDLDRLVTSLSDVVTTALQPEKVDIRLR